jgi:hypothetical protein
MTIPLEIRERLSPLQFDHINFNGRYPIARPDLADGLRQLRDASTSAPDQPLDGVAGASRIGSTSVTIICLVISRQARRSPTL